MNINTRTRMANPCIMTRIPDMAFGSTRMAIRNGLTVTETIIRSKSDINIISCIPQFMNRRIRKKKLAIGILLHSIISRMLENIYVLLMRRHGQVSDACYSSVAKSVRIATFLN